MEQSGVGVSTTATTLFNTSLKDYWTFLNHAIIFQSRLRTSRASLKISSLLANEKTSVVVLERADETPATLDGAKANAPPKVVAAIMAVTPAENFIVYLLFGISGNGLENCNNYSTVEICGIQLSTSYFRTVLLTTATKIFLRVMDFVFDDDEEVQLEHGATTEDGHPRVAKSYGLID